MSTSTYPAPTSPALSPTSAPRPLQLIDPNFASVATSPTSTCSPPAPPSRLHGLGLSTPPPSARAFKPPNPRRQSSISYFPSDHVSLCDGRPPAKGRVPRRSNSMGVWGDEFSGVSKVKGDRRSLGNLPVQREPLSPRNGVDHGPLTLTEKHADLLQFIAQKEAKCMELRSQLEVHESELVQLKKKWERIVSRGMDRAYSSHPTTPSVSILSTSSAHAGVSSIIPSANAALKEGVRLIAAGLELSPPTASLASPALSPPAVPISGLATVSRASLASTVKASARHTTTMSVSSVTTNTTATSSSSASTQSQRLSQSSASSLTSSLSFDEALEEECAPTRTNPSPIPEEKSEELAKPVEVSPSLGRKLSRRRSHESEESPVIPSASPCVVDDAPAPAPSHEQRRKTRPHPVATRVAGGAAVPPTPTSPMASLMSSVGRKWEEIQKGHTFTKSQKRASLLISDVSQSLFAALASPAPISVQAPLGTQAHAHVHPPRKHYQQPTVSASEPRSLLEDDIEDEDEKLGDVLVPSVLSPTPVAFAASVPAAAPAAGQTQPAQTTTTTTNDDDDWNW